MTMNRADIRHWDDYGAPHPGRVAEDTALKKRILELRSLTPGADAGAILNRIRSELKVRGQAEPKGLDRLVSYLLR